jgi:hypothetical protein
MNISMQRAAAVTAALAVTGFVFGGVIGTLVLSGLEIRDLGTHHFARHIPGIAFAGLTYGGAAGAILTPPLSWLLLRRVSLGRALRETAIGSLLFAAVAIVVAPQYTIMAALGGFVAAALRLRLARSSSKSIGSPEDPPQLAP